MVLEVYRSSCPGVAVKQIGSGCLLLCNSHPKTQWLKAAMYNGLSRRCGLVAYLSGSRGGLSHVQSDSSRAAMSYVTSHMVVDISCQLSSRAGCSREGCPRVTETQPQAIAFTTFHWSKSGHRISPDPRERDHRRPYWYTEAWFICGHVWILVATRLSMTTELCPKLLP